ncbi:hypothetical protein [Rhodopseudomonas parapalustris]
MGVLLKIDNIGFVGGDTSTYEFDFGIKVAGSVAECPMRLFFSSVDSAIPSPLKADGTVNTAIWFERTTQSEFDNIKNQDAIVTSLSTGTNGKYGAVLVELDLTRLCNAFFGGNNATLIAAFKNLQADVWGSGSGSNAGVLTYGVQVQGWWGSWTVWNNSTSSSTTKITGSKTSNLYISSANKAYILINAQYASNGTITSAVNIDYLKLTLQFARVPDVIKPIPITLPKYWAMIIKGISPAWDSNETKERVYCTIYSDINNWFNVEYISSKPFGFYKKYRGALIGSVLNLAFNKYQASSILVAQTQSGMVMYQLTNNGSVNKVTNTNISLISGECSLYLSNFYTGNYQSDTYTDSVSLIDLEKLNKPLGFTDQEAQVILTGRNDINTADDNLNTLAERYKNSNLIPLFNDSRWNKHANASVSSDGKTLILNANALYQYSSVTIPVLPNNKYILSASVAGNVNTLGVYVNENYNNIRTKGQSVKIYTVNGTATFTTGSTTNNINVICSNDQTGVFTFSNLELRRYD